MAITNTDTAPDLVDLAYCRAIPALASTTKCPDALLSALITAVSKATHRWCNRIFLSTIFTDVLLDGTGERSILLPEFPVISVEAIQIRRTDGTLNDTDITDLIFETSADRSDGEIQFGPDTTGDYNFFPRGSKNVVVDYTAGLGEAIANLPADLKLGVALWVSHSFSASRKDLTLKSESIGKYKRDIMDPAQSAMNPEFTAYPPDEARKFLSSYRKFRV